jgi:SAM-dependent methyltransferase
MLPSRHITNKINWVLDQLLPPLFRDNRILMQVLIRFVFKKKAPLVLEFKEKAPFLTPEAFSDYNAKLAADSTVRPTSMNVACQTAIREHIVGTSVLDAGCGGGYLAFQLAEHENRNVTGLDLYLSPELQQSTRPVFVEGSLEALPFDNESFDTVVSTHTLEHVQHPDRAVAELRRVARHRLLLVVPCQREYRYTFDLHIHFFPYVFSLQKVMKNPNAIIRKLGGDFFYMEDLPLSSDTPAGQ